ncbi:MAG: GGDEF domain-containing protein [Thermodesulfovibrio sp.]|nr:GGDEF domain-containing protein [Thermodesulfovibrio sp.]
MNLKAEDLKDLIPSIIVDNYYNVVALNSTAQKMFGEVKGEKCYKIFYGFNSPCYQKNIICPIYHKLSQIDIITLDFEVYIRSYGGIPLGGLYYESLINITNVEFIRSAIIDSLTGIYNRRFIEDFLEKLFNQWKRYNQIFSLIYIDIDQLKEINDRFGHSNGDEAIIKISDCLKMNLRDSDIAGRMGGDEFMIVLPNTALQDAQNVALRILKCVKEVKFITKISISLGVTEVFKSDENYRQILDRADEALYRVKNTQRGTIGISKSEKDIYCISQELI